MFPEAYTIGTNFRLNRLTEFGDIDLEYPPMGHFIMWEPPIRGCTYTIGVDPSWGVGQDRSAIHVLKNGTVHNKDMQVGEFSADSLNPHDLTPICYMLGNLYKDEVEDNEALMSVECNISDDVVQQLRNTYNYNNLFIWKFYDNIKRMMSNKLGWWTNARTRPKIIVKAMHYVKQGWWDINSPWMINELQTLEKLEERQKVAAASGHHDDLAFAGFIALWSAHDMEFNEFGKQEEVAKQRERKLTNVIEAYTQTLPPLNERKDFINTACSAEDMYNYEFPER